MKDAVLKPSRKTILIVADDRSTHDILSHDLTASRYRLLYALSIDQALEITSNDVPDLAILGAGKPNGHPPGLWQQFREKSSVPFIVLSDRSDSDMSGWAAKQGALAHLFRPVDLLQMVAAIEVAIARATEIQSAQGVEDRLNKALASARNTSIATGILMERLHIGRDKAFETLRTAARTNRCKIDELAGDMLHAAEALNLVCPVRKL